jgi:hypothetical protein
MADYRLVLDGLATFVADITATSGSRSIRRFPSEAAALMWIAEQGCRDAIAETMQEAMATNCLSRSRHPTPLVKPIGNFAISAERWR